jgi:hypothetical protein
MVPRLLLAKAPGWRWDAGRRKRRRGKERRGERKPDKSMREVSSIKFSFLFLIALEQSIFRGLKIHLKFKTQQSLPRKIEKSGKNS